MSVWTQANPQLKDLVAYKPGKPIEELARERGLQPGDIIKMASNENPLGPSPKAVAAMQNALTELTSTRMEPAIACARLWPTSLASPSVRSFWATAPTKSLNSSATLSCVRAIRW
ncbi:hypothetical protein [Verrucomicrobium spinosum]|uniref:hypothetical protein n=1 Tax=Verrucomicrobium spinosum TaxID=2736 RepID=UPI000B117237|nr:hypothetical protein [Verrucomicrobium spinosum]